MNGFSLFTGEPIACVCEAAGFVLAASATVCPIMATAVAPRPVARNERRAISWSELFFDVMKKSIIQVMRGVIVNGCILCVPPERPL